MGSPVHIAYRIANQFYKSAFPVYRPFYRAFKTWAERGERRLLARHLVCGSIVVDAGANIGFYSQFFAHSVGPTGVVHSFEPNPENFARLRSGVSHLQNVRLNQLAVGDETKESLLYISDDLNVDHRIYPTEGELRQTMPVNSIRLDDYFNASERVDLLKLDIQGYELHALRGAERVLDDNPSIKVLVEFWPYGLRHAGASPEHLLAFLAQHRFTVFALEGSSLNHLTTAQCREDGMAFLNLFAERVNASAVT